MQAARAAGEQPVWEFLTPGQAADVEAIAAQIVPTDDTPGAREAGVVFFIDHGLATWAQSEREPFARGLDDLNRQVGERWPGTAHFTALPSERQIELLRAIERSPFFREMRYATIAGMFANPAYGGNHDRIGWQLLGFEDRFIWQPPFGEYDADGGR